MKPITWHANLKINLNIFKEMEAAPNLGNPGSPLPTYLPSIPSLDTPGPDSTLLDAEMCLEIHYWTKSIVNNEF